MRLRNRLPFVVVSFVVVVVGSNVARADDELHDHGEFTMGFLAGERRYADVPFSLVDARASISPSPRPARRRAATPSTARCAP